MSNFWIKDDAFLAPGQLNDSDMVGPIFDEPLPGSVAMAQQNQQKQPGNQHSGPDADMFAPGDMGLGEFGLQKQGNPLDNKLPQMFMRNDGGMVGQHQSLDAGQGNSGSQQLDRQKQEQLLKMRQQIMHQQMVHNQQKAQHRQQPELAGARSSPHMNINNGENPMLGAGMAGPGGMGGGGSVPQSLSQNLNQNFMSSGGMGNLNMHGGGPGGGPGGMGGPQGPGNLQFMGNQMNRVDSPHGLIQQGGNAASAKQGMGNLEGMMPQGGPQGMNLGRNQSANQNLSQNVNQMRGADSFEGSPQMGQFGGNNPAMAGQQGPGPNKNFVGQRMAGAPTPGSESGFQGNSGGPPKLTQSQFALLQYELLQMSLADYMNRRNTPITQAPVVNNKKINLLILHLLTRKIGGFHAVLRHLQTLNQPSAQVTDWTNVCRKLGLLDGIDIQSNIIAKQQIEKLVGTVYLQYILPYEQYDATEEGRKDLHARRIQFQRQLYLRFQQQQQQLQRQQQHSQASGQNLMNQNRQQSQPQQQEDLVQKQQQNFQQQNRNSPLVNQFQSAQSPHTGAMPTPSIAQGNKISQPEPLDASQPSSVPGSLQRKSSQASRSNHGSPAALQSPYLQQQGAYRSGSVTQRLASVQLRHEASTTPRRLVVATGEELVEGDPNTIRKYVPIKESTDTHGSIKLKNISDISAEIELTKPVYLFAPELGSLNIHALTMSLKNYLISNPGEIYSALNTLLVTTTDANCQFKVSDAPELLDALINAGLKILSHVQKAQTSEDLYQDVKSRPSGPIEAVFEKYVKEDEMNGEDIVYNVDSLTAELVEDDDSDIEVDDIFSPEFRETELPESSSESPGYSTLEMPDFLTGLLKFREENKHYFSKIQTKSATDTRIFFVDLMITVTMTLRNLSFTGDSRALMASNRLFRDLIFKTIKAVAVNPDAFVFQRKRFCLLKDCLVMLDQIAFHMELESLEEAFLTYLLVSAFAPKLDEHEDDPNRRFDIPGAQVDIHTYLPYGVDTFAKLLVREPKSRAFLQAVLTGSLNVTSSAEHPSARSVTVTPEDHHETKKLALAYLKGDQHALKSGRLLTRAFKLMMSTVPFTVSGIEFTRFALQRSTTTLQALFGVKLIIDLIPSEDVNAHLHNLPLWWLAGNIQMLLFNFTKNTLSLITESVKFPRHTQEHKILSCVGTRSLTVVNSLLGRAVTMKKSLENGELDDSPEKDEIKGAIHKVESLYRVQPESEFVLNTLLAASIDPDVAQEVVRLHGLLDHFQ